MAKQASLRSAATILTIMVAASRILGLVRDRLLAARFAPDELGVYFAAFRLPNLLFELLVMGALTSAFIPVFTRYINSNKHDDACEISSTLINGCIIFFVVFAIPLFLFSEQISRLIAPGFTPAQIHDMALFTRAMVLFQVLPLLLGNFFTGILQSYNIFFIPALAPVVYNIGIIIGILVLTPFAGLWAPVYGIAIGAGLFTVIQLPSLIFVGFKYRLKFSKNHPGVREVMHLMIPRTIGLAISQVDTTVDLILASLLGARMVTIFSFAQHLQQLPIGLFGATVAQAAFPLMAQSVAKRDPVQFQRIIVSGMNSIAFFCLPMSVLFIVLRVPIVRLVFGAARFDWQATVLTGMTLSAFSLSLWAQSFSQLITRGFYAHYDTKTPVIIGIVTIFLNTFLSILFVKVYHLPVWSLGLSTSLASIINAGVLIFLLRNKIREISFKDILIGPGKMIIAALAMGVALYVPLKLFDQLIFDTTRTFGLIFLTGVVSGIGLIWYLFLVWVLGVPEVHSFIGLLDKVRRQKLILEPASEVVANGVAETPVSSTLTASSKSQ